jgi:hypothetical protein
MSTEQSAWARIGRLCGPTSCATRLASRAPITVVWTLPTRPPGIEPNSNACRRLRPRRQGTAVTSGQDVGRTVHRRYLFQRSVLLGGMGSGASESNHSVGPQAGVTTTWTTVSGTLRILASCAAQRTALLDDDDPSTPTRMPRSAAEFGISLCPPSGLNSGKRPDLDDGRVLSGRQSGRFGPYSTGRSPLGQVTCSPITRSRRRAASSSPDSPRPLRISSLCWPSVGEANRWCRAGPGVMRNGQPG